MSFWPRRALSLVALVLLAGLSLTGLVLGLRSDPPHDYEGHDPGADWRGPAQARIEKYRKARLKLKVEDKAGPLSGARVRVRMTGHAYRFGTQVNAELLMSDSQPGEVYRRRLKELFNYATLNVFYNWTWDTPEKVQKRRASSLPALKWLKDNGFRVRGHVLVWNLGRKKAAPPELAGTSDEQIRQPVRHHLEQTIGDPAFAAIDDWDVLNEPSDNSDLFARLGVTGAAEWFAAAHQFAPEARLFVNEHKLCSGDLKESRLVAVTQLIKELQKRQAPVDGLGLQSHHIGSLTGIPQVLDRLERLGSLGLALEVTEYDVRLQASQATGSFEQRWRTAPTTPPDPEIEQLEADYLRDYLTACFSSPATTGFVIWGFDGPSHWLHNSPLYREDGSEKPGLATWKRLVYNDWWTNADGVTDSQGEFIVQGFLGDYEVVVEAGGHSQTLKTKLKAGGTEVVLRLDGNR